MSLERFCYLYSVDTSAFYTEEEQAVHEKMLRIYFLRKKIKDKQQKNPYTDYSWRLKVVNKALKEYKQQLTELLVENVNKKLCRSLNNDVLNDKAVINLFESSLTRALNIDHQELTKDIIIVNIFFFQVFESIVKYGFLLNGEKYIFLTASAGQIRTKKAVFIKEKSFEKIKPKIMCGLTIEKINENGGVNTNKFLAYLALSNSATDVWKEFDIDKSIVVDDFETFVKGEVDHIDANTYEIQRAMTETLIPHTDGCGMVLKQKTRMVRLPWVKGLLVQFPFDEFIKEKCNGTVKVKDIYGKEYDIIADGIEYIFTKSQFKLYKHYASWDEYKKYFKQYNCEACYCNIEEDVIPQARINYQMLQTLTDMKQDEIEKITLMTRQEIEKIGVDFSTTMRLLGATSYNKNKSAMQEALIYYPELYRDSYGKEILKQTKKSLVKQAKGGRLRVNGRYLFISPDLYAFCEWLFLGIKKPKGLLKDGEVYTSIFGNNMELACLRSPHLYREWAIRTNIKTEELNRWFGNTKCLYTSIHDLISRILQFDVDGDKALVIRDNTLVNCAKRNMENIVPLAYDMKKAQGELVNSENLYNGMCRAYTGGNIGIPSNNITKIWNNGNVNEEAINVVKWLCMQNNQIIDYAKTLWKTEPPKDIQKIIRSYTKAKVPQFFIYAKDKEKYQVATTNDSTMNRISNSFKSPRISYSKKIDKIDWRVLINLHYGYETDEDSEIIKRYNYWVKNKPKLQKAELDHIKNDDMWIYKRIREDILLFTGQNIQYITNCLVAYLYTIKQSSNKKILWGSFGDIVLKNVKENTKNMDAICPYCGQRFKPKNDKQHYCSVDCYKEVKRIRDRKNRQGEIYNFCLNS